MRIKGKTLILGKLFSGLSNKTIVADSTGGDVKDAIETVNFAREHDKVIKLIPEPEASIGYIGVDYASGKDTSIKTMCGVPINTEGANEGYLIANAEAIEEEIHKPLSPDGDDTILEKMHELQRQLGRDYSMLEFLMVMKLLSQGREVTVLDGRLHTELTEADKAVSKERVETILGKQFLTGGLHEKEMADLEPNQLYNREVEQADWHLAHNEPRVTLSPEGMINAMHKDAIDSLKKVEEVFADGYATTEHVTQTQPIPEGEGVKYSLEDYLEQETELLHSAPSPLEGESYSSTSYLERLADHYKQKPQTASEVLKSVNDEIDSRDNKQNDINSKGAVL